MKLVKVLEAMAVGRRQVKQYGADRPATQPLDPARKICNPFDIEPLFRRRSQIV